MKYWFYIGIYTSILFSAKIPVISDRKSFQLADAISNNTQVKLVDLGRVEPTKPLSTRDLLSNVRDKKVLIVIHGYNMTYTWAIDKFTRYHEDFSNHYDQVVGYLWPGGNQWWEYRRARRRTLDELPYRFLASLSQIRAVAKNVDVLAHSMGCRLILETLSLASLPLVRNLFLTAPAVDQTSLQLGQCYHYGLKNSQRVYVFYSKHDEVSTYAFPIVEGGSSLGRDGCDKFDLLPFNVSLIDCTHSVKEHSGYADSLFVKTYMKKILGTSKS